MRSIFLGRNCGRSQIVAEIFFSEVFFSVQTAAASNRGAALMRAAQVFATMRTVLQYCSSACTTQGRSILFRTFLGGPPAKSQNAAEVFFSEVFFSELKNQKSENAAEVFFFRIFFYLEKPVSWSRSALPPLAVSAAACPWVSCGKLEPRCSAASGRLRCCLSFGLRW